ncbi:hypothetical protein AAFF_G00275120 [Aldrovandia affinis]|uniref:Uncharacterized protein n=1 Tax=Aldrovandia affinis TaxID=143900 RepID=A0AAD7WSR7_9TELE|nr:hypothetical protein AAFF_G00275120 [Aldrovandia affinis]
MAVAPPPPSRPLRLPASGLRVAMAHRRVTASEHASANKNNLPVTVAIPALKKKRAKAGRSVMRSVSPDACGEMPQRKLCHPRRKPQPIPRGLPQTSRLSSHTDTPGKGMIRYDYLRMRQTGQLSVRSNNNTPISPSKPPPLPHPQLQHQSTRRAKESGNSRLPFLKIYSGSLSDAYDPEILKAQESGAENSPG